MVDTLSPREFRVLELAATGLTDKGIGAELGISPTTVLTYWTRIRGKIGPLTRAELVGHYVHCAAQSEVNLLKAELEYHIENEHELEQKLNGLTTFIDCAPVAMLIVRPEGTIQSGNALAADLLECRKEDFPGLRVGKFIPPEIHDKHRGHRAKYFRQPARLAIGHEDGGVEVVSFTGRRFNAIVALNMAETPHGKFVVVILRSLES